MRTALRAPGITWVIWAMAAASLLPGCGMFRKQTPSVHVSATPARVDLTQAAISGAEQAEAGLEVNLVVSTADRARLAGALAPYLDDQPAAGREVLDLWKANGLRLVRVPLGEWPRLSQELRFSGATQRQWVDQTTGWTEIVRGPERPRGQTIALDAERLELGPGRLRVLGRCWLAPVTPSGTEGELIADGGVPASLNIELLPQHLDAPDPARKMAFGVSPLPLHAEKPEEGLIFRRLMLSMSVRRPSEEVGGGWAYVLVAERPGTDWREALADRPQDDASSPETPEVATLGHDSPGPGEVKRNGRTAESAGGGFGSGRGRKAAGGAGPTAPSVPTLGEALFGRDVSPVSAGDSDGPAPVEPSARALIVLIPRVPASYRLIAPTPAQP